MIAATMAVHPVMYIVGRAGLASLFLLGGLNKMLSSQATLETLVEVGLEPPCSLRR